MAMSKTLTQFTCICPKLCGARSAAYNLLRNPCRIPPERMVTVLGDTYGTHEIEVDACVGGER